MVLQCLTKRVHASVGSSADLSGYGRRQRDFPINLGQSSHGMNMSIEQLESEASINNCLSVTLQGHTALYGGRGCEITLHPGITTLVGPNGAGKTRMLRAIAAQNRDYFDNDKIVRFISAGRNSPLERFRSSMDGPGHQDMSDTAVGNASYRSAWWQIESITGDLLALEQRSDLRLKVEARLQQLFHRSLRLEWGQTGIRISIVPMDGGEPYSASHEASGILQLVGLLAAIHNNDIGLLVIDEPEISLHPQHQAFIRQEMEAVAGDPKVDPTKKIIVIATHSPSILSVRSVSDIASMIFFTDNKTLPIQIHSENLMLKNRKLISLVARLSATHRLAFFATTILLVEGPSDEIIATQLARASDHPLMPVNAQIIPVTGKGEFVEVIKLFKAMGKDVAVLADLDALTDSNNLVNFFSGTPVGIEVANTAGSESLAEMDGHVRSAFSNLVDKHWGEIATISMRHSYWLNCSVPDQDKSIRRRAVLATLLENPSAFAGLSVVKEFDIILKRFTALLSNLEKPGLFFLRRGTIEDYYQIPQGSLGKPEAAAVEASEFFFTDAGSLEARFSEVFRALSFIAPIRRVDENRLLRTKLAAVIAAIFQQMTTDQSNEKINAFSATTLSVDAALFRFENTSTSDSLRITVFLQSPLFQRSTFPFEIGDSENITAVIKRKLPSQ